MNILAACSGEDAKNQVYNVAVGQRTTLNDLYKYIVSSLEDNGIYVEKKPIYRDFRIGDVRHSQADIKKAISMLAYEPRIEISEGIRKVMPWYCKLLGNT
jgi:UDP-N-acetylglucosamine 4-epimerase